MDQKRQTKGSPEADLARKTKLRAKYARLRAFFCGMMAWYGLNQPVVVIENNGM